MKKIILPILGLFVLSCTHETPDYFKDSVYQRIDKEVNKYNELLVKPANGWAVEYYPGGSLREYGGVALTAKFDKKGFVEFRSVYSDDFTKGVRSLFSVKKDIAATLNFDTYNSVFHTFSDPDSDQGEGKGTGLAGDYEFILQSSTDKSIVMKGKKYLSIIRMYALEESPEAYLKKVKANYDSYNGMPGLNKLSGKIKGKDVSVEILHPQYLVLRSDDESKRISFLFNDKGAKLYEEFEFNGAEIKDLIWNPETGILKDSEGNMELKADFTPNALFIDDFVGDYVFSYGAEARKADVKVVKLSQTMAVMKGLPFDILMNYNTKSGCLEIFPQNISTGGSLAMLDPDVGTLSMNKSIGIKLRWTGDEAKKQFEFVPNGETWTFREKEASAKGFILWDMENGGPYKKYGNHWYDLLKIVKK